MAVRVKITSIPICEATGLNSTGSARIDQLQPPPQINIEIAAVVIQNHDLGERCHRRWSNCRHGTASFQINNITFDIIRDGYSDFTDWLGRPIHIQQALTMGMRRIARQVLVRSAEEQTCELALIKMRPHLVQNGDRCRP